MSGEAGDAGVRERPVTEGHAPERRYYDWRRGRPVDADRDGCPLDAWLAGSAEAPFAVHPAGFPVFVPASELAASDEYRDSDPYSVAEGLSDEFQMRRFRSTLDLAALALGREGAGSRILDVACGQGHITAALLDRFPKARVSGFDYSVSAIEYATGEHPGIAFAVADAYEPPYPPGHFDLVVCNNIWEHVADPLRLLAGISRVLRPGGHVVISTPSRYRLGNVVRLLRGKPVMFMSDHHVTEYSVGQVVEQLRFGGYDVVEIDSRPLSSRDETFGRRMVRSVVAPLLRLGTRLIGSHHSWEGTVFFLARRREDADAGRAPGTGREVSGDVAPSHG